MARIRRLGSSEVYETLQAEAQSLGESCDCAVKVIAVAAGMPYAEARGRLLAEGRKPGQGAHKHHIFNVIRSAGLVWRWVDLGEMIARYPGAHRNLRSATTHHPDRFPDVWRDGKTYLAFTAGHALAIVDGVNHDHTRGRAVRIIEMYEIFRPLP